MKNNITAEEHEQDVVVSFIDAETGEYDEIVFVDQDLLTLVGKNEFTETFYDRCASEKILPAKILSVEVCCP